MACYSLTVEDFHLLLFAQSPGALPYLNFRFVRAPLLDHGACVRRHLRSLGRIRQTLIIETRRLGNGAISRPFRVFRNLGLASRAWILSRRPFRQCRGPESHLYDTLVLLRKTNKAPEAISWLDPTLIEAMCRLSERMCRDIVWLSAMDCKTLPQ